MSRVLLILVVLSLAGCNTRPAAPELVSWSRNGLETVYIYYEDGGYYIYRFREGKLVSRERL